MVLHQPSTGTLLVLWPQGRPQLAMIVVGAHHSCAIGSHPWQAAGLWWVQYSILNSWSSWVSVHYIWLQCMILMVCQSAALVPMKQSWPAAMLETERVLLHVRYMVPKQTAG
jgi:hypothetical protein